MLARVSRPRAEVDVWVVRDTHDDRTANVDGLGVSTKRYGRRPRGEAFSGPGIGSAAVRASRGLCECNLSLSEQGMLVGSAYLPIKSGERRFGVRRLCCPCIPIKYRLRELVPEGLASRHGPGTIGSPPSYFARRREQVQIVRAQPKTGLKGVAYPRRGEEYAEGVADLRHQRMPCRYCLDDLAERA